MKLNELEVLHVLKNKLLKAAEVRNLKLANDDFGSLRWKNSDKRVYYLYDYRKNLFETPSPQIKLGTGIKAVRSSAAMIYNLFGEASFILDRKSFTGIEYEKTFPAINGRPPAHLDAVFQSSDNTEMYAIEAKVLEWKDSPKNLAKAYLDKRLYPSTNKNSGVFVNFFKTLVKQEEDKDGRLKHKTRRYDAIQMTIHTLALYNHFCDVSSTNIKKLTLLNVVWKYDCDEYAIEEEEAARFVNDANELFVPLFKRIGIDFSIQYSTLQDFKKRIDFSKDPKRAEYLKRYDETTDIIQEDTTRDGIAIRVD